MDSLLLCIFSHMSCCDTVAASQQSASGSVRMQSELAALADILRPPPRPLSESVFLLTLLLALPHAAVSTGAFSLLSLPGARPLRLLASLPSMHI